MSTERFNDCYESGAPVDQVVFNGGEIGTIPKVKWSLPNGDRITTTLADYNRNFPFIFQHEAAWRNAMNLKKRQRLGLTETEEKSLADFDAARKADRLNC